MEVWSYSPCLIFFMIFEEKYLYCYILLLDKVSITGCLYFVRYWTMCIVIVCCDVKNFEINVIFLIKPFLLQDKNLNMRMKGVFVLLGLRPSSLGPSAPWPHKISKGCFWLFTCFSYKVLMCNIN